LPGTDSKTLLAGLFALLEFGTFMTVEWLKSYKIRQHKKRAFLAAYAEVGNISAACRISNNARSNHYDWLDADETYAHAFVEATEIAGDRLEDEARRRAVEGVTKPIFQGGKEVGEVQEYSDTLLIFLMKGARPEKYRERHDHNHSGASPFEVVVTWGDDGNEVPS
jgi:hypothetical protein